MTAPVDGLLVLQEIDVRIAALEVRNAQIPRRRAEVSQEITALEAERGALADSVERGRLDRRALETELETQQGRRARYEAQLNEVKTNVAYSALLTEIQTVKRTIGDLEGQILELMAAREESERRIGEIDAELEVKRTVAAGALEELEREAAEIGRALDADRARRDAALPAVDARLLRLYDRLRKARRFPALIPLRGQACGACHNRMPPQVVQEIRHSGSLHVCEACGVLVYSETEAPAEARSEA